MTQNKYCEVEAFQDYFEYMKNVSYFCIQVINNLSMGGLRTKPDTKKITASRQGYGLAYASCHMCGWRLYMEDAQIATHLTDIKNQLFAIFDGHGGPQVSNFCSRNFARELQKNSNYKKKNYELSLKQTFLKMDELLQTPYGKSEIAKIQKQMKQRDNCPKYEHQAQAGSTANVCLITPEMIYVANAGDSRSVACTIKGQCIELSKDHKPQNQQQLQRIKKAGGVVTQGRINGKLNLSRAIGDFEYKNEKNLPIEQQMVIACPDIIKIKNEGLNFIIMGCDGIWQVKSNVQMANLIQKNLESSKDLGKILQILFDMLISKDQALDENGLDNMSAILIKFTKSKK